MMAISRPVRPILSRFPQLLRIGVPGAVAGFAESNRNNLNVARSHGHIELRRCSAQRAMQGGVPYHAARTFEPRRFLIPPGNLAARVQSAARPFLSQRRKDGVLGGTELRQRQYLMPVAHFRPAWLSASAATTTLGIFVRGLAPDLADFIVDSSHSRCK